MSLDMLFIYAPDMCCLFMYERVCMFSSESVAVALVSLAAPLVAAVRPVLVSWMVRRPGKGESLML